jgi:pullulanase/glycogen debranching enzyme
MEAAEAEPYQAEQSVQGGEEKHGLQGEQAPDPYEVSTTVAAGGAAGAAAAAGMNGNNSFAAGDASERSSTVDNNAFASSHDNNWLNIDDTTPAPPTSP